MGSVIRTLCYVDNPSSRIQDSMNQGSSRNENQTTPLQIEDKTMDCLLVKTNTKIKTIMTQKNFNF